MSARDKRFFLNPTFSAGLGRKKRSPPIPFWSKRWSNWSRKRGGKAVIGDSPGAALAHTKNTLIKLYRACGLDRVAMETGAELALDTGQEIVAFPGGRRVKRFEIIKPAIEADLIINLPKFKTHSFTRLTGAVKNIFGLVPGLIKPAYHAKIQDVDEFSAMLVDLLELINPCLTIVDGIWAMEGSGPGSGDRREVGLIVAGQSAPAVDVVLSRIMGVDPETIPTVNECVRRGLLDADWGDIEIRGVGLKEAVEDGFAVPAGNPTAFPAWANLLLPLIKRFFTTRPVINTDQCRLCGDCVRVCPVEAMEISQKKVTIDYRKCIRCFCCHETCPHRSIRIVRPLVQRLLV